MARICLHSVLHSLRDEVVPFFNSSQEPTTPSVKYGDGLCLVCPHKHGGWCHTVPLGKGRLKE